MLSFLTQTRYSASKVLRQGGFGQGSAYDGARLGRSRGSSGARSRVDPTRGASRLSVCGSRTHPIARHRISELPVPLYRAIEPTQYLAGVLGTGRRGRAQRLHARRRRASKRYRYIPLQCARSDGTQKSAWSRTMWRVGEETTKVVEFTV